MTSGDIAAVAARALEKIDRTLHHRAYTYLGV
jgi:hypothetical protein